MKTEQDGFLELRLYSHPSGATLNPEQAVERLKSAFPEVEMLPGDQLAASVARIEKATAEERARNPSSPVHSVLESERRKSRTFGPAFAFRIPNDAPRNLWGRVRRYDVLFFFDTPLDEEMKQRIIAFLLSFGVGWIEQSVPDARQTVVLYDLPGVVAGPPSSSGSPVDVPS